MRRVVDREGQRWEAAVAFGSYGQMRVIFSRLDGDQLRSRAMGSNTQLDAERELDSLEDDALIDWLDSANAM